AYGVRDELLVGDFFDVTLLDPIEDFDKRTQILQWQVLRVSSVRALCKAALGETDHHTNNDAQRDQQGAAGFSVHAGKLRMGALCANSILRLFSNVAYYAKYFALSQSGRRSMQSVAMV